MTYIKATEVESQMRQVVVNGINSSFGEVEFVKMAKRIFREEMDARTNATAAAVYGAPAEYDGGPTAEQFDQAMADHDEYRAAMANDEAMDGAPW